MRTFFIIFSCFVFFQCSADRKIHTISKTESLSLLAFQKLDSINKLFITDANEPGEKLLLCLTFINKESKKTLVNQQVQFYHTSTVGDYEPSDLNDETTARLNGTTRTNAAGKLYIETIVPGDYGSAKNNRHIHTTVFDAKPQAYDLFFKQYSSGMGQFMNSGNDQIFFADLKKTYDNKYVCFVTIEVKNAKKLNKFLAWAVYY